MHAAVSESLGELTPWMSWPKEHWTVEDSEASARQARARFVGREGLMLLLLLRGTRTLAGSSGLHRIGGEMPKFEIG